jgi:hypothetical protein
MPPMPPAQFTPEFTFHFKFALLPQLWKLVCKRFIELQHPQRWDALVAPFSCNAGKAVKQCATALQSQAVHVQHTGCYTFSSNVMV